MFIAYWNNICRVCEKVHRIFENMFITYLDYVRDMYKKMFIVYLKYVPTYF